MATLPAQGESFKKTPQELAAYNAACPRTGSYYCRIFKFIHLGTLSEDDFNNKGQKKDVNKFRMYMEFLTHPAFVFDEKKGPQPWTCNVSSTYSTGEKSNLYKYIKNIFGNDPKVMDALIQGRFNISAMMNMLVMVDTVQNISKTSGQANIKVTNITAPLAPPGYDLTPFRQQRLYNELVIFDIDDFIKRNPADIAAFKKLYKFEQKMITETEEWRSAGLRLEDYVDANAAPQQGYAIPQQQGYQQPVQQQAYQQPVQQGYQQPVYQQPNTYVPDVEGSDDLPF
jgi:hypothetical protein